jgi:hypothetical protein
MVGRLYHLPGTPGSPGGKPVEHPHWLRIRVTILRAVYDLNNSRKSRPSRSVLRLRYGNLVGVGSNVMMGRKKKAAIVRAI